MRSQLAISELDIEVVRKKIRNIHLTVHPPEGRVRIAAPSRVPLDTLRLFAISKLPWIRRQRLAIQAQARETRRDFLDAESHYVWGRRYLLQVVEHDSPPEVALEHRHLILRVRPGTDAARRDEVLARWQREQLREALAPLLARWEAALGVRAGAVYIRRMKTKWGSCNHRRKTIRLNTELARKPPECLEYVAVHELVHLIEPSHNRRFVALMDRHLPDWKHRRTVLNRLPLGHEDWEY